MKKVCVYDTTLRDGTQGANVSFTAEEKLMIAHHLDEFGVHFIEGGWPNSNPRDMAFFELAQKATFKQARLVAFSSTRKASALTDKDLNLKALLEAETSVVAMFGKSWDFHVSMVLCTTLDENLAMIRQSVEFLTKRGREVVYDAEQFFDGYRANPKYAIKTLVEAVEGGAKFIVLCDTNGGTLVHEIEAITSGVRRIMDRKYGTGVVRLGIHAHNDCGLAVANSIAAIRCGAVMVQGTINGYGERAGNADLTSIIPVLVLKMGIGCVGSEKLKMLRSIANLVSQTAHMIPVNARPFVGKYAFAHKAGVHVNAVMKTPQTYEHIDPTLVGNKRRVLVSDLSGRSNIESKAEEYGIELGAHGLDSAKITEEVKRLEKDGYQFDVAEGSLKVLLKRLSTKFGTVFALESLRLTIEKDGKRPPSAHLILKVRINDRIETSTADGHEPVRIMEKALREVLVKNFPHLDMVTHTEMNVRLIEGQNGREARVRVVIESHDEHHRWSTMGVSENILEASWHALADSFHYKLTMEGQKGG